MAVSRVTVSELLHDTNEVFKRLAHEGRLEVTRGGRLAGTLIAPDPGERVLDEWAERGEIPTDWRKRQHEARRWLHRARERAETPTDSAGSDAVIADRDATDR